MSTAYSHKVLVDTDTGRASVARLSKNKMLKRKLLALEHHNPELFDINDEVEYRSCVLWLEDQKIRHYKIEERDNLRQLQSPEWDDAFQKYQKDLNSPVLNDSPLEKLSWLLSHAIRLEYADQANKYNAAIADRNARRVSAPNLVTTNPLDSLDFSSNAFATGVSELAMIACVGPHPDPRIRLSAIASLLKTAPHPPPPQNCETETSNTSTDVLNLMFISELRTLQTLINEALVAVQKITANPKTDTSLGKVGY